jgi:hypothetical protein
MKKVWKGFIEILEFPINLLLMIYAMGLALIRQTEPKLLFLFALFLGIYTHWYWGIIAYLGIYYLTRTATSIFAPPRKPEKQC